MMLPPKLLHLARSTRVLSLTLVAALCFLPALADAKKLLHNIDLGWKPTSKLVASSGNTALAGMAVQIGSFTDARDNKNLIGENREEADEGTVLPVSTVTDIPGWVGRHLKDVLQQNGVNVVASGATVVIDGDVRRFFVEETNNYQANVVLHLRARDAGGAVLWETNLSANSSRFGRSYKQENYTEVLSDALVTIAHSLLNHGQLRDALAGGAAPRPAELAPVAEDPIIDSPITESPMVEDPAAGAPATDE